MALPLEISLDLSLTAAEMLHQWPGEHTKDDKILLLQS